MAVNKTKLLEYLNTLIEYYRVNLISKLINKIVMVCKYIIESDLNFVQASQLLSTLSKLH